MKAMQNWAEIKVDLRNERSGNWCWCVTQFELFFLWYMLHKALANGVASRSKYVGVLWPVLACSWDNLRSLWSRSNLHTNRHNFSPFAHLIQINASFARAKKRYNFVFSEEFSDSRYPVYAMLFKSITLGWSLS